MPALPRTAFASSEPMASRRLSTSAVDARDEERRDGADRRQVLAVLAGLLEAGEEGVHHRAVAVEGEDQRHVDRDALGEHLRDGRQALDGRRDLDEDVRPVDRGGAAPWPPRRSSRCRGPSRGSTSMETRPSSPSVASKTGFMTSQASRTSRVVRAKTASSTRLAGRASSSTCSSYALPSERAAWKIDGFVVTPTTPRSSMSCWRLPERDPLAREVVEPDGDAVGGEVLERLRCGHGGSHFPPGRALAARRLIVSPPAPGLLGPRGGVVDGGDPGRGAGRLERVLGGLDDRLGGEPELAEERRAVGGGPEVLEADAASGVPDEVVPPHGDARLDADAGLHLGRQDLVLVGARLLLEPFPTRHRDHPGPGAGASRGAPGRPGRR